ncbi:MAG TPA: YtxH domain-containing protein [Nitrospirota bacterium]|nr:YtxH domain-containing protein [Nitrospirota bacterium]
MTENLNKKEPSIIVPFLLGSIVGAALGLLLAPKSGKELRKDLKDYAFRATDKIITAVDEGKKIYEDGKSVVASALEAGKTAFHQEKERQKHQAA